MRRFLRINKLVLLALLAAATLSLAQESPPDKSGSPPKFTVSTSLVVIPALVSDKQGNPIEDLRKEDFVVKEDGKPQTIAVFEHVKTSGQKPLKPGSPNGIFTNQVGSDQPARLTIVGIDMVSMGMVSKLETRKEILEFISRNVSVDQPVALFLMEPTGVRVVHDFTTDSRVLLAALSRIIGGRTASGSIAQDRQDVEDRSSPGKSGMQDMFDKMIAAETDTIQTAFLSFKTLQTRRMVTDTLDDFYVIAQAFSGVPGRKSLIWITNGDSLDLGEAELAASLIPQLGASTGPQARFGSGMSPSSGQAAAAMSPGGSIVDTNVGAQLAPSFERVWHALNTANIAVYPLDVSEISNPALVNPSQQHRGALSRPVSAAFRLEQMAGETGGVVCPRTTELDDCFKKADADSEDYYLLAYYPSNVKGKDGWKKLEVTVTRREAKVRARNGYFRRVAPKPDDEKQIVTEIITALRSPLDYTSLPLEVRLETIAPIDNDPTRRHVAFAIRVPPSGRFITEDNHVNLDFAALAKSVDSKPAGSFSQRVVGALKPDVAAQMAAHGLLIPGSMDLLPGEYQLKIVVRDNQAAHLGSLTIPLKVEAVVR